MHIKPQGVIPQGVKVTKCPPSNGNGGIAPKALGRRLEYAALVGDSKVDIRRGSQHGIDWQMENWCGIKIDRSRF